jgi:hypothetical protein
MDPGIAHALDAIFAIGTKSDCSKWREEIEKELENSISNPAMRWAKGTDTGAASMTIFYALIGNEHHQWEATKRFHGTGLEFEPATPLDAADFGRCYRLVVKRSPDWEARLPEVARMFPETKWSAIVEQWANLKALFEKHDYNTLHDALRSINS